MRPAIPAPAKTYTRDEFKALVMGKTRDAVRGGVGLPDSMQEDANDPNAATWYYDKRTIDPVTGKTDVDAQVVFEDGVVVRISFH